MTIKKEQIALLEARSKCGGIELFYGDETGVGEVGYVPYGWPLKGENLAIMTQRGKQLNCFGILSKTNKLWFKTTDQGINSDFIVDFFEDLSFNIRKLTVLVLGNARIHTSRKVREWVKYWQQKGLYIFYLPPYSPHLNIIERTKGTLVKTRGLQLVRRIKLRCHPKSKPNGKGTQNQLCRILLIN
jgi:transposase